MTELQVVDLGNFPVDEATPVVAGPRGPAGADGMDGASAYEVAVANGFVGTEAEWLASLKGADGVGGGGGGAVDSVNGQVGVVVLDAADVGARPDTYVPAWDEVTGKPAIPDSADDIGAETPAGAQAKVDTHAADTTGVHGIADTSALATAADVSAASTADRARANHTGTQSADTLTDGTTNKAFLATERTKLAGVATGATANDTDANLKNRANHTGSQTSATISDLTEAVQDVVGAMVVAGTNVTKTYDDTAGTLTITATGGGGGSAGLVLLKEVDLSADAASIAFTSADIPTTGYRHLQLVLVGRTTQAVITAAVFANYNGDTTAANYSRQIVGNNGGTLLLTNTNDATIGFVAGTSAAAGVPGHVEVFIANYRRTTFFKTAVSNGVAASNFTGTVGQTWKNTAAIDSIVLTPATANFLAGTVAQLYGIA